MVWQYECLYLDLTVSESHHLERELLCRDVQFGERVIGLYIRPIDGDANFLQSKFASQKAVEYSCQVLPHGRHQFIERVMTDFAHTGELEAVDLSPDNQSPIPIRWEPTGHVELLGLVNFADLPFVCLRNPVKVPAHPIDLVRFPCQDGEFSALTEGGSFQAQTKPPQIVRGAFKSGIFRSRSHRLQQLFP